MSESACVQRENAASQARYSSFYCRSGRTKSIISRMTGSAGGITTGTSGSSVYSVCSASASGSVDSVRASSSTDSFAVSSDNSDSVSDSVTGSSSSTDSAGVSSETSSGSDCASYYFYSRRSYAVARIVSSIQCSVQLPLSLERSIDTCEPTRLRVSSD